MVLAVIAGVVAISVAAVTGFFSQQRHQKAVRETLGEPNGQGNVVEMIERVIRQQGGLDEKITAQAVATERQFAERSKAFDAGTRPYIIRLETNEATTATLVEGQSQIMAKLDGITADRDQRFDALEAQGARIVEVLDSRETRFELIETKIDGLTAGQATNEAGQTETHDRLKAMAHADVDVANAVVKAEAVHESHLTDQDEAIEVVRDQTAQPKGNP